MRYLSQLRPAHGTQKISLLRVDYNIETQKETFRLESSLPTIKFLIKRGFKVVILSHRGRPKKKIRNSPFGRSPVGRHKSEIKTDPSTSLKVVLPFLKSHVKAKIVFFNNFDFPKIKKVIDELPQNSIAIIENLRLLEGEENNSIKLARQLKTLGDIYVNDAFSVCHRKNASVAQLPKLLPSFAGLLLEKEIKNLNKISSTHKTPLVIILGGAKVRDKIGIIRSFLHRAKYFLLGGYIGNTFLKARGLDIGRSGFDPSLIGTVKKLMKIEKFILPIDFIIHEKKFLDIGPLTIKLFNEKMRGAKTIFWNGPMGFFEDKRFAGGSEKIAKALGASRAFTVVGGGETTQLVNDLNIVKKISFVSTGGGAMLMYLSGKKLPGIEALK